MSGTTYSKIVPAAVLVLLTACGAEPGDAPVGPQAHSFANSDWSEPVWLGPLVNSPQRDLAPALSPDGLSLYFNSERSGGFGGMDIWVARRPCGACPWEVPVNLGALINTAANDESPSLSNDGHLLFFGSVRPSGHGGIDLYVSWRTDTKDDLAWGPPVNLGPGVNSGLGENGPAYLQNAAAGTPNLYFDVVTGGHADIYAAAIRVTGRGLAQPIVTVVAPAAPVPELNDPVANSRRPSLRADGRELLFWSGPDRGGLGGADLWVSTRPSIYDAWSPPENLGAPVNYEFADLGASLSLDGRTLVFSSSVQRGGLGRQDFWMSTRTPSGH